MKQLNYFLGILCTFCVMIMLLITSVEAVTYWTPGYYEKEYTKYQVTDDVNMEMDDLLDVTHEMMAFLKGKRDDLHVLTIMGGQEREFFSEREIAHMEDVRDLFLGGMMLRRICVILTVACICVLVFLKVDWKRILAKMFCFGSGLFVILATLLGIIISTDFTKYFIIFHEMFFSNDLWILDPSVDMLINIVPEPFFMDTAARICLTFGFSVLILFLLCFYYLRKTRKKLC